MTRNHWLPLGLSLLLAVGGGLQALFAEDAKPKGGDSKGLQEEEKAPGDPKAEPQERGEDQPKGEKEEAMRPAEGDRLALPHDGVSAKSREFTYEIAFHTYGAEVYILDLQGDPIPAEGISGTIEMSTNEPGRLTESAILAPMPAGEGGGSDGLRADMALDHLAQGEASAIIRLKGLPGTDEKEAEVQAGFRLARIVQRICPQCYFAPRNGIACEGCKLPLVEQRSLFVCPVHAEIASDRSGAHCWRCAGQALKLNVERAPVAKGIQ